MGAVLAFLVALVALVGGVFGNLAANLLSDLPPWFVWLVFGVASMVGLALAVVVHRVGATEPSDPRGPLTVRVAGAVDSADEGWDIWPLAEFDQDRATVHPAIGRRTDRDVGKSVGGLPPAADDQKQVQYLIRDHDPALRADVAAAARGELAALILLQGSSSTGKTRSLFEAVHAVCPTISSTTNEPDQPGSPRRWRRPRDAARTRWRVLRPAGREALLALSSAGVLAQAPTVLWLNEVQGFLGPNGTGLTCRLLEQLYRAAATRPLVVVGTVWPNKVAEATSNLEASRDTRELLASPQHVRRHPVADHLSGREEADARSLAAASGDHRLHAALDQRDGLGFTQALAGARELLGFYRYPPTPAREVRLVLEAAADYRRLGGVSAMSRGLLRELARVLWTEVYSPLAVDESALDGAIASATTPLRDPHGGVRALLPVNDGYTLTDYLEQHLRAQRRLRKIRDDTWEVLLVEGAVTDQLTIGISARARGRHILATQFFRTAVAAGDRHAYRNLANLLELAGRQAEAEQVWRDAVTAGVPEAALSLAHVLERMGREAEAEQVWRDAIATDVPDAHRDLAYTLQQTGRRGEAEQVWRDAITAGHVGATGDLAYLLERVGRHGEAEQLWRDAIAAGVPNATSSLANLLEEEERWAEVEQVWRDAVAARDVTATGNLADLLERVGRHGEAEQLWRDAIAAGVTNATRDLAYLLERVGRHAEAEQLWRDAIAAGVPDAHRDLATMLEGAGREAQAEQVWRDAVAAGVPDAHRDLAKRLERAGREAQAEQVWRDAIAAGVPGLERYLLRLLERVGRHAEAEQIVRDAITAGVPGLEPYLLSLLERVGRHAEAEQIVRDAITAGVPDAPRRLAHLLQRAGRHAEAEQAWRDAITVNESRNTDAVYALGMLLLGLARTDEAAALHRCGTDVDGNTVWSC